MSTPLIARLLLDAQEEFVRATYSVPGGARRGRLEGMNSASWVIAHAAYFHDVWINVVAQGRSAAEACDPWLLAWMEAQETGNQNEADFEEARAALQQVVARASPFVRALTDDALDVVPDYSDEDGPVQVTVGYLVARDIAHLFSHAAELNVIATSAGAADMGLPGDMPHTSSPRAAEPPPKS
jgi:hypothetical protein